MAGSKPKRRKPKGPREMERRRIAVQATADAFAGHPFAWGEFDCAKMVLFHLARLGVPIDAKAAGSWTSAQGARAALKRLGFDSLEAVLDAHFDRIGAASARLGDVVAFEANSALGGLGIHLGNASVMCYHVDAPDGGPIAGRLEKSTGAWRVING
jgi:hypothetical protein